MMFSPNVDTPVTDEANNVIDGGIHISKEVPIGKMIQMVYHIRREQLILRRLDSKSLIIENVAPKRAT